MNDNDNLLSISQKLLKKISNRTPSEAELSDSNMENSSPESSPQLTEQAYQHDSRFRKYVQLVEKNLQSFDAVNEWADIISFLGRLLKSFQAYPQFPIIPRKQLVAKRLAQCLNPGFPAGVHQKTLEVYAYILKTIGPNQLAIDLALWSTGLFPFVQYAATHVKPQLLTIFERYYIPLREKLRPAMRGFIIALLPALEEEGSEYFDKVVLLIESLSETVELPFFYSCMWLVMINNPNLRPPALNYLLRKLPKIIDREAVALVLGGKENVSLMVRAFTSTLNDQQLLVQRSMLELFVQNFMLKSRMIPYDDLVILMRAALGIVLRKDMSLNRRLYAWLLGSEGSTQAQVQYFSMYAEKPATQAVRTMLQHNESEQQRPYKILISLMDKWELGQPIVGNVFVDALTSLAALKSEQKEEVLKTANMWMDMVEPYMICTKLFELIDSGFPAKKSSTSALEKLRLVEFTLSSFSFADEEMLTMHFPLILAALTKKLNDALKSPLFLDLLPQVGQCITLILNLLERLPDSVFSDQPTTTIVEGGEQFTPDMNVLEFVRAYYGHQQTQEEETQDPEDDTDNEEKGDLSNYATKASATQQQQQQQTTRPTYRPLRGALLVKEVSDNLSSFLIDLINSYIVLPDNLLSGVDVGVEGKRLRHIEHHLERVFLAGCTALTRMAKTHTEIELKRKEALTTALLRCCQQVNVFGVVDAGLSALTWLVKHKRFVNIRVLTHVSHTKAIMDRLWGFLAPSQQLLHMRTVELMWLLVEVSRAHQIETLLSNYLIHPENDEERLQNYDKFGVVWELSEKISEASTTTVFSRPMFLMLDLLREGASPLDRRAGDLWVRCHLKSYVRLLEPFMLAMLDKHIIRRPAEVQVPWEYQQLKDNEGDNSTTIAYSVYLKPFDTAVIDYMFTTLITLITFGGLNVLKACKNFVVEGKSAVAELVPDYDSSKPINYLDLLVLISIRYLETEPKESNKGSLGKPVCSIQLHAADLLYLIVSKLDFVNMKLVKQVQFSVLHKLLLCITYNNLDLQQKLLHLLHACLAITCASTQHKDSKANGHQKKASVESVHSIVQPNDAVALIQTSANLIIKCITDAFSNSHNRSMLQHWMDFVLASLPYLKHGFRHLFLPILISVCYQISLRCDAIEIAIHEKPSSYVEKNEIMVLLTGLEKMLMFALNERGLDDEWFDAATHTATPRISQTSPLVGLTSQEAHSKSASDAIMYHLPSVLQILLNAWHAFRKPQWDDETLQSMGDARAMAILQSFDYASQQAKGKMEAIFGKLCKHSIVDFVEGLIEIFYMDNPAALEFDTEEESFEPIALEVLTQTSTPQYVLSTLLDSVRQRTPGSHHSRRRKILRQGKLTDTSILRFAEIYCDYINHPESIVLLWPMIHSFAKDYLSQANTYKIFLPGLMRFLTVALEELSKSASYEQNKRIRKDAQELYQRCVDFCILIAGKSFDQSLWMRTRSTLYDDDDTVSVHTVDSTDSPYHHGNHSNVNTAHSTDSMPRNVSTSNVSDMEKKASWKLREDVMINQVNQYLAHQTIPRLRQLVGDNDKINSLLNNLVYYVIGPSLKSKVKSPVILDQLCEMARMPFTYKTWRKEVWDMFIDNRFFYMNGPTAKKWLCILQTAFSIEKERMTELMARITTSPSNTFFSNKDQETLNRSLNLRRLSFVLFAGTRDQYVPQLPIVQEKIVELLKLDHSEMVHTEIYLCLRIILMRFSQKHLMNFWPVLITELMRLFNSFVYNDFQDRPEEAQIALAGCKFLDLLCTLELDAFQIYQWIFIRDTVETLIKTKTEGPTPIMESLNEKISTHPTMDAFDFSLSHMQPSLGSLKRPMLTMHSIASIRQLSFFVEHVGLYVYQSSFTLCKPDLPFIESLLQNDLLEEEVELC